MRKAIIIIIITFLITGGQGNSATAFNTYFFSVIDNFSEGYPFKGLTSLFVSNEELYVVDNGSSRVYIFDSERMPIFQFGREKGLEHPVDLIVSNNNIYITQEGKDSVEIFNMRGEKTGNIPPPFKKFTPGLMAVNGEKGFFVVDKITLKVCAFDKKGKFLYYFGGRKTFSSMTGIAVKNGTIYISVMDSEPLVRIFDIRGEFLSGFGKIGESNELFSMPSGLNVDEQGTIWVSDAFKHRVIGYSREGKKQFKIGGFGNRRGALNYPQCVDYMGDFVYVLEKGLNRISIFKRE